MHYNNFIINLIKPNHRNHNCQKKYANGQKHSKIILFPLHFTSSAVWWRNYELRPYEGICCRKFYPLLSAVSSER